MRAQPTHAHPAPAREIVARCSGDASFTRSEDPCTSILTTHRARARWWGTEGGIAVGQTHASGRNQHRGHRRRTERGSPRDHRSGNGGSMARSEKEGGRGLRPCEDPEPGFGCSHVVVVAQVGRRRPFPNTLGKRAPKRAAGSSEQGSSVSGFSAGETAGDAEGRKDESLYRTHSETGEDRYKAQGGERSSSSGHTIAKSGEVVAGPGL